METQERFPQGLGNLAQNARFPHSHKPIIVMIQRREKNGNSNSAIKPSTESDQVQVATELANDLQQGAEKEARARLGAERWAHAYAAGRGASIDALLKDLDNVST